MKDEGGRIKHRDGECSGHLQMDGDEPGFVGRHFHPSSFRLHPFLRDAHLLHLAGQD